MNILQKLLGNVTQRPQMTQQPQGNMAQYEDQYTPTDAAQPVDYRAPQVSLNGNFLQGIAQYGMNPRITSVGTANRQQAVYDPRQALTLPPDFSQYGMAGMRSVSGNKQFMQRPMNNSGYDYIQPL